MDYIAYAVPLIILIAYLAHKFYFNGPSCKSKNRLDGKVVIITGANCGIGYETALDLAYRNAHIILACRDRKKAQEAADKIILFTNNKKVEVEILDLASLESIRQFVNRFKTRFDRLDILINNAGLAGMPRQETKDGFELQFGVMHLGHFLLTNLLIDLLRKSAPSRVVNVSSIAHKGAKLNWEDLQMEKFYKPLGSYRRCKLANILFTNELARRFKDDGIISVSLHPGVVRTEIWRELEPEKRPLMWFLKCLLTPFVFIFFKDCKQGAQTTIHCAVSDEVLEQNGSYFEDCKPGKCSNEAKDVQSAKKLWDVSLKLVGLN